MKKLLRELKRTFPDAEIRVTGSNHYAVILPNGRVVIVSGSPSHQNFMRNAIADARRQSKRGDEPCRTK